MINSVSFAGEVYQPGNIKQLAKPNEIEEIQRYADEKKVDVMLINRDYYLGGTGYYPAILIKPDKCTGNNVFAKKTFDFVNNPTLKDESKPEYKSCLSDLYL